MHTVVPNPIPRDQQSSTPPQRLLVAEGIERGLLAPFHYVGRIDPVDYQPIPWRNGAFSEEELEQALCSDLRMELMWELWGSLAGKRTILFCASIKHANFTAGWLQQRDVRALPLHTGPDSAARAESLQALRNGEIDALCVVDLFNEGLDLPEVDRIVMLRPTASSVLFLQQLGRGLRLAPHKERLNVLDLVGNHHVFLERLHALLSLKSNDPLGILINNAQSPQLPAGCSLELELGIIDLLNNFIPSSHSPGLRLYREYRLLHHHRPTLNFLYKIGISSSSLYKNIYPKSWFHFLEKEGDLLTEEQRVLQLETDWFLMLERTPMTKSYKMIALQVLVEAELRKGEEGLNKGMSLQRFRSCCWELLHQDPILAADLSTIDLSEWPRYWDRWLQGSWDRDGRWLVFDGTQVRCKLTLPPALLTTLAQMSLELIHYRLSKYRVSSKGFTRSFICRVSKLRNRLALRLPAGKKRALLPTGELTARLPSGALWSFRLVQNACHVAHPHMQETNQMPELLRTWFGASAGETPQQIRFSYLYDGWWVEPIGGLIPAFRERFEIPYYQPSNLSCYPNPPKLARLPYIDEEDPLIFSMHAYSSEMSQEHAPINAGDWLVLRKWLDDDWSRLKNQIALFISSDHTTRLRRLIQQKDGYALQQGDGRIEPFRAGERPFALLLRIIPPEELIPALKTELADIHLTERLGLSQKPSIGLSKVDGHCFLLTESTVPTGVQEQLKPLSLHPKEHIYWLTKSEAYWSIESILSQQELLLKFQ